MALSIRQLCVLRKESGFTIVEILVVVAIMTILAALMWTGMSNYASWQRYLSQVSEIRSSILEARSQTLGSVNDAAYGVYVGTDSIEFFSGATPTPGDPANTILPFTSDLRATSTLSNGAWFVTFSRVTGEPSATGTIRINHGSRDASTTLRIYGSGLVE